MGFGGGGGRLDSTRDCRSGQFLLVEAQQGCVVSLLETGSGRRDLFEMVPLHFTPVGVVGEDETFAATYERYDGPFTGAVDGNQPVGVQCHPGSSGGLGGRSLGRGFDRGIGSQSVAVVQTVLQRAALMIDPGDGQGDQPLGGHPQELDCQYQPKDPDDIPKVFGIRIVVHRSILLWCVLGSGWWRSLWAVW